MAKKAKLRSARQLGKVLLPAVLIALAGFWLAYQFVRPAPPDHITLAAGSAEGAYYRYAQRMAKAFAAEGIDVTVLTTAGSGENLRLLEQGEADLAFVQSGIAQAADLPDLRALAALYPEPLWIFHRLADPPRTLHELRGLRIGTGAAGSGTRKVVATLLADNRINANNSQLQALSSSEIATALRNEQLDVGFIMAGYTAPVVRTLLDDPDIHLMNLPRATAYERRDQRLQTLTLPAGVLDPARDQPPETVQLLASAATLVGNKALHPALIDLSMIISRPIFAPPDLLRGAEAFPAAAPVDFPLAKNAERFLKRGPSFLQRYLPFWAATLLDRLVIMIVPLLTLMIPLIKVLPPVYRWRIRSRVYRWYDELEDVDDQADKEGADHAALEQSLDAMLSEVMSVDVPLAYADQVYHLREHIELVRRKLHSHAG